MEITYQNIQQDFDDYYAWYAKETKNGKNQSWKTFVIIQIMLISYTISFGSILSWVSGPMNTIYFLMGFIFLFSEVVLLALIKFRVSSYMIEALKRAEDFLTKKQRENNFSPTTIRFNDSGLEISNLLSDHCYKWQLITEIIVKNNITIILIGVSPVLIIPRRTFDSEESYNEFSSKLVNLYSSHKDQPISETPFVI